MSNMKMKICEQAQILFNEKGYRNVSLREIAEAAGTTIGNLTYHYPQKEDLILEIQKDLYGNFLNEYTEVLENQDGAALISKIVQSFVDIKENRDNHVFFYRNIVELSQQSDIIAANIEAFRLKVFRFYSDIFLKLRDYEIMRQDITEAQYERLAYAIVTMTYIWTQDTTLYYDKCFKRIEINDALNDMIYPYLTEYGAELYCRYYSRP